MAQIDRELEREEREQQALGAALSAPVNIPRAGLGEPLGGLSPSAGSPLLSGLALLGSRAGGSVDQVRGAQWEQNQSILVGGGTQW